MLPIAQLSTRIGTSPSPSLPCRLPRTALLVCHSSAFSLHASSSECAMRYVNDEVRWRRSMLLGFGLCVEFERERCCSRKITQVRKPKATNLHALELAAEVVLVQIAVLYLLGHLTLALPCFLGILQLESVLVHREAHCLGGIRLANVRV